MPEPRDDAVRHVADSLRDAVAVAVGLGVLAVNRVQAVRRQVRARDAAPATGENRPTS